MWEIGTASDRDVVTQPFGAPADNGGMMSRTTFETGHVLISAPYETEMWLLSLSRFSPRHAKLLWPGFDDAVNRLARSCAIRAKA